jgi:hypothetical protein
VNQASFSFQVPASGWISQPANVGGKLDKDTVGPLDGLPDGASVFFWSPDRVYADPCAQMLGPNPGPTAAELAAAVSAIPGTDVVAGPLDVALGDRAAKYVELTVSENADCDASQFYLWRGEGDRYATALGDTIRVWIADVDGTRIFIEAETRKNASAATEQESEQIVNSIKFH